MGIEDIGSGGKKEDNGLVNGDLMQTAQNSATAAAAAAQQTTEALNQLKINIGTSKSSPNEGGGVEVSGTVTSCCCSSSRSGSGSIVCRCYIADSVAAS